MKGVSKKVLSILISFCLIISFISIPKINSYARNNVLTVDKDNKIISLTVQPYGGLKREEAIILSSGLSGNGASFSFHSSVYDYETKKYVNKGPYLQAGKVYRYTVEIKSDWNSNYDPFDMSGYEFKLLDCHDKNDQTFISNAVRKDESKYHLIYECDIKIKPEIVMDLGTYYMDLSKDGTFDPESVSLSYRTFSDFFDQAYYTKIIKNTSYCTYDLDQDGTSDIADYDEVNKKHYFYKLDTCSVVDNFSIKLDEAAMADFRKDGIICYSEVVLIFGKQDISKCEISGIEDMEWNGSALERSPVIKYNGKVLEKDRDYELTYENNVEVGTATVNISGINCFEGATSKTFQIKKPVQKDNGSGNSGGSGNNSNDGVPVLNGTVHGDLNSGLWVELSDGSYPKNQWGIVNGKKYYFDAKGYAAANEYASGMWFDGNGNLVEGYSMEWKCNDTGWWIEDKSGWYPVSRWLKIDGYWYYFLDSGYMDYSEYRDGYWLGSDGALVDGYYGQWKSDSTGWWFEDKSGWYPTNQYLWIDGVQYWFDASGYMA